MKEAEKQIESNIFEGMTSIRAVLHSIESGRPYYNRKIISVLCDETKKKARQGELSYIKAMSYKHNFELKFVQKEQIDSLALGNSHGGLLMETTPREIPELSVEAINETIPKEKRFFGHFDETQLDDRRRSRLPCVSRRVRAYADVSGRAVFVHFDDERTRREDDLCGYEGFNINL